MPVDETSDSIRIRQRDPDSFVQTSFRTITLSEDQGIKAVIGKLKSDPAGSTVIQSYIFDKSKWTSSEAETWVKDHKSASRQYRTTDAEPSEIRVEFVKSSPKVYGYAAIFNARTRLGNGFYEQVAPGAFSESLAKDNVYALWQHDWTMPLGDLRSGTLALHEDEKGLAYELNPGDTDYALNLVKNIKRGVVRQSSFGFDILKDSKSVNKETREVTRTIEKVRLYDVSPVTLAAYPQTDGLSVREVRNGQEVFYIDGDEVIELGSGEESAPSGPSMDELAEQTASLLKKVRGS